MRNRTVSWLMMGVVALTFAAVFAFGVAAPDSASAHGATPNRWGYDFNGVSTRYSEAEVIYYPAKDICDGSHFHCVSDFWVKTRGYVVQCKNGKLSHSGGVRGVCSGKNGGVLKTLYMHEKVTNDTSDHGYYDGRSDHGEHIA